MNLKELQKIGFVDANDLIPVKRVWSHKGEELEVDFFIVRQSYIEAERIYKISSDEDKSSVCQLISSMIRLGKDGKEKLTYENAEKLVPSLAMLFIDAINEVTKNEKK